MNFGVFVDIDIFIAQIIKGRPLMAFDMGAKKIGVAKSDPDHKISLPYKILLRKKNSKDLGVVAKEIISNNIFGIVFGITNYDSDSDYTSYTKLFVKKLLKKLIYLKNAMPILLYDENYTSIAARSYMKSIGYSLNSIESLEDKFAATILLEDVLSYIYRSANLR